jgi:hypothetical protein
MARKKERNVIRKHTIRCFIKGRYQGQISSNYVNEFSELLEEVSAAIMDETIKQHEKDRLEQKRLNRRHLRLAREKLNIDDLLKSPSSQ